MAANLRPNFMFVIRYLVRFLVHNDLVSKETIHSIIGVFLYVPLIAIPIVIVAAVLVGLRKVSVMGKTAIINLIFASGATLLTVPTIVFHRNKFHWENWAIILFSICWLACAIGLFFRKRLAWCGSILGAGVLVFILVVCLAAVIPLIFYPRAESEPFPRSYIFICIIFLTWMCLALAISMQLLFGLLRMRSDIFGGGQECPPAIRP
jgi:hypothetical protein